MTNQQRIEELETALENLLDNIEVSVDVFENGVLPGCLCEAMNFAAEVLSDEGYEYDSEDQG